MMKGPISWRMLSLILLVLFTHELYSDGNSNGSDNLESAIKKILDNALMIKIEARLLPDGKKAIWNQKSEELTIPGRSVAVKLVGENLTIYAIFTPYKMENGNLLLVAQGQVWLTEEPQKEIKYLTTFKSIPISLGEKIVFFPLGFPKENKLASKKYFNIELEIQIVPYRSKNRSKAKDNMSGNGSVEKDKYSKGKDTSQQ